MTNSDFEQVYSIVRHENEIVEDETSTDFRREQARLARDQALAEIDANGTQRQKAYLRSLAARGYPPF